MLAPRYFGRPLVACLAVLFTLAFLRCYLRTETTLTGYHLGELKGREAALLEERSRLKVQLARLTTKESLIKLGKAQTR